MQKEVKISTLIRTWKKLTPTLMDDFEGFKISDMTEVVQSHNKTLNG